MKKALLAVLCLATPGSSRGVEVPPGIQHALDMAPKVRAAYLRSANEKLQRLFGTGDRVARARTARINADRIKQMKEEIRQLKDPRYIPVGRLSLGSEIGRIGTIPGSKVLKVIDKETMIAADVVGVYGPISVGQGALQNYRGSRDKPFLLKGVDTELVADGRIKVESDTLFMITGTTSYGGLEIPVVELFDRAILDEYAAKKRRN